MALDFRIDRDGDCASIHLKGNLTLSPQLSKFAGGVTDLFSTPGIRIVLLHLAKIDGLDGAVLGELVILYTAARTAACSLCLVKPVEKVRLLLEMTKLADLFPQFPDEETAKTWARSAA